MASAVTVEEDVYITLFVNNVPVTVRKDAKAKTMPTIYCQQNGLPYPDYKISLVNPEEKERILFKARFKLNEREVVGSGKTIKEAEMAAARKYLSNDFMSGENSPQAEIQVTKSKKNIPPKQLRKQQQRMDMYNARKKAEYEAAKKEKKEASKKKDKEAVKKGDVKVKEESGILGLQPDLSMYITNKEPSMEYFETKDTTATITPLMELHRKLPVKKYQIKQEYQEQGSDTRKCKHLFKEEGDVEVFNYRLGNLEPPAKKEKLSRPSIDLLDMGSEDSKIEVIARRIDPILAFKVHVTDQVKVHLLDYYARDSKDVRKKRGELKELKIKTESEFKEYCKFYSKKFQSNIFDAYTTMNGSADGIEKENIERYNIGYDIHQYFSRI